MRIRVLGAGVYGCHLGLSLIEAGHDVEIHDCADKIFAGASGKIPARLHAGSLHYPRSAATRKACMSHSREFMDRYGFLTRSVPVNIYAVAADHSLVDFETYHQIVSSDLECIRIHDPSEFGLRNVEGAILTGERHILAREAATWFRNKLNGHVRLNCVPGYIDDPDFDLTIDCTFAANSSAGVDRYEPCLTLALHGPVDRAITVMDGPFPSLYPWSPASRLSSLSSAKFTPFSKTIRTYAEARAMLDGLTKAEVEQRGREMFESMRTFYPAIEQYQIVDHMLSIRAMPLSGADTRLVDVRRESDRLLRVRAGKIDAVLDAERMVKEMIDANS